MFAYAFSPFRFLAPVLHKITGEKCRDKLPIPEGKRL
jgi:hypothetical protein